MNELIPLELGPLSRQEPSVRVAFEVAQTMGENREQALIRVIDALARGLIGARARGVEKLCEPSFALTEGEPAAILEKCETVLEERWDDAKGERRQFLLAACEGVAMARRLFTAGPGDPDPRTLETEPRPRPNPRREASE